MKKLVCTIYVSIFLINSLLSQEFVDIVYPFSAASSKGKSCFTSPSKSVYFTGEFSAEMYIGLNTALPSNFQSVYFSKRNHDGNIQWVKTIKGTKDVFVSKIHVYDDYLLVAGIYSDSLFIGTDTLINTFQKGVYVAVYDTLGNYRYSINPDCQTASLFDVTVDETGKMYACGDFFNSFIYANQTYISPLGLNFFWFKYDLITRTELLFKNSFGSGTNAMKIQLDSQNDVVLVGSYGEETIVGNVQIGNDETGHNMYVAKYDQEGNFKWVQPIFGMMQTHGLGLAIGDNDDVFVSGEFEMNVNVPNSNEVITTNGLMDALFVKYDKEGTFKWMKQIGNLDSDQGIDMVVDISGNPILLLNAGRNIQLGETNLSISGFNEPMILKLNKFDGSYIWHSTVPALQNSGLVKGSAFSIHNDLIAVTGFNFTGIESEQGLIVSQNLHDFFLYIIKDTNNIEIPVDDVSILKQDLINFTIYPNPMQEQFFVQSEKNIDKIEIFTLDGQRIYLEYVNKTTCVITPDIPRGMYLVKMLIENKLLTTKIIKL